MAIKYSKARLNAHKGLNPNPNDFTKMSILSFEDYYKASDIEYGIHGPEEHANEVYISIYHYMQYRNIDPSKYNTRAIGAHLANKIDHGYACKYTVHHYSIYKFKFTDLHANEGIFASYKY